MSKISLFGNGFYSHKVEKFIPQVKPKENINLLDFFDSIREGEWQDEVLAYRNGKYEKGKLMGVTPSGTFSHRKISGLVEHSGIIVLDVDAKDQIEDFDINETKLRLLSNDYVHAIHVSCGGKGLAIYVKINPKRHNDSFISLEQFFANEYHLILDSSGKDVSRFRFVSYDPDLYLNEKSKTWRKYIPKKKSRPNRTRYIFSDNDLDHVFQQISDRGIDLTYDYQDWYNVGCALSDYYGSGGLNYFHHVSSQSTKYDSDGCEKLFKILLKRKPSNKITIGTFLWMCKQKGIDIKTRRTKQIERASRTHAKMIGENGGYSNSGKAKIETKKYLEEQQDIEGEDVDAIFDRVLELPKSELNKDSEEGDLIEDIEAFLDTKKLKFNEVLSTPEIDGEPMTDRDYNSLYIDAKKKVSMKVTKDLMGSIIDSDHTKTYNPFLLFFDKYKHIKPEGLIDEVITCFDYEQKGYWEGKEVVSEGYLEVFLRKWMLSIISSMNGTYSLLILVLTGKQGTNKSNFFRNLLPEELKDYYAESKLDEGKDSEILMCNKILIVDDEFSGKSKSDAKRLKDMSSKQTFNVRKPYGHRSEIYNRYAVLGGTSNDEEIINDPTGNRRIIPVNVNSINIERFKKIDKVELFMELYNEWKETGDKWMLDKAEIEFLNQSTKKNEQPSIEEEMISKYFIPAEREGGLSRYMTNSDIKTYIESRNSTIRISPYKLGASLKKLGFHKECKRINGGVKNVYLTDIPDGMNNNDKKNPF